MGAAVTAIELDEEASKRKTIFDLYEEKHQAFSQTSSHDEVTLSRRVRAAEDAGRISCLTDGRLSRAASFGIGEYLKTKRITEIKKAYKPDLARNWSPLIGQLLLTVAGTAAGLVPAFGPLAGGFSKGVVGACNAVSTGAQGGASTLGSVGGLLGTHQQGVQSVVHQKIEADKNDRGDLDHSRQMQLQSADRLDDVKRKQEEQEREVWRLLASVQ